MRRVATTRRWVAAGGALVVALAAAPVAAQAPSPTTSTPSSATPSVTTSSTLPPTSTTATPAPAPEQALVTADDEASYRAALAALSTAPSGPNTLELAADIVVDDGTDPTYTGTADLNIDGHGHTLDGAGANRLLVIQSPGANLALANLTVRNGWATGDGGGVLVESDTPAGLVDVTFTSNQTDTGNGGAISTAGNVDIESSTFAVNAAPQGDGGAIDAATAFPVGASTFVGNVARRGGALATAGESVFVDDTFSDNTATERGGALRATGGERVIVIYVTSAGNTAPVAANLDLGDADPDVIATAVADAHGGQNCDPAQPFGGFESFSDDASCGTDGWAGADGADALLGPLQDNGGPTETMEPAPTSPLVDAIDPLRYWQGPTLTCATYPDQRGVSRPQDGNGRPETGGNVVGPYGPAEMWCDIGAVEREAPPAPPAPVALAPRFTG